MNYEKAAQFRELVEAQTEGSANAFLRLRSLSVSLEDGYCLYNLYGEWAGAFSYDPGRSEALPAILSLARKVSQYEADDTIFMYNEPEWRNLLALRGPVETVIIKRCAGCSAEYPRMGTNGFYDASGLVCPKCGDVFFKSYFEEDCPPCPSCGGRLPRAEQWGCPACGAKDADTIAELSPYEYFSKHSFKRGPGA